MGMERLGGLGIKGPVIYLEDAFIILLEKYIRTYQVEEIRENEIN
jgi:hypothetical protein